RSGGASGAGDSDPSRQLGVGDGLPVRDPLNGSPGAQLQLRSAEPERQREIAPPPAEVVLQLTPDFLENRRGSSGKPTGRGRRIRDIWLQSVQQPPVADR